MRFDVADARPEDAPWIAEIWNHVIAQTLVTFTTDPKPVKDVAALIGSQPVFVLPDQAGFATYGPFRAGPGYAATREHSVYMRPDAHGQGGGRRLMLHLLDHARRNGARTMVAGISGANPGAVRFHESLGFERVGLMPGVGHKAGQWLDLILMQKALNLPDTSCRAG